MYWISEREAILEQLENIQSLNGNDAYTYKLTHYYDHKPRPHYFKSNINPNIMDALIAYIQFEMFETVMSGDMNQSDVILILKEFYQASDSKRGRQMVHIDLYLNWEKWYGFADRLSGIELFKREGLEKRLKEISSKDKR